MEPSYQIQVKTMVIKMFKKLSENFNKEIVSIKKGIENIKKGPVTKKQYNLK